MKSNADLTGHLLLAAPNISDPKFAGAAIYICTHDHEGAVGVNLTKKIPSLTYKDLVHQLNLAYFSSRDFPLYEGGPLEQARGFVLHSGDYQNPQTASVTRDVSLTTNLDVLRDINERRGPKQFVVTLGYAGWQPGQLEKELADNMWLHVPADNELLFNTPAEHRWETAIERLGFNADALSYMGGSA